MNRLLFLLSLFTPYLLLLILRRFGFISGENSIIIMGFLILFYSPLITYLRLRHLSLNKDEKYITPFKRLFYLKQLFTAK